MKVLIDGDIVVYRIAFAMEKEKKTDALWMLKYNTDKVISKILHRSKATSYAIYINGKNNFRENIATLSPYKAARKKAAKPVYWKQVRDYLIEAYNAELVNGMETDDKLGIVQCTSRPNSTIIATIDKDLDMIPFKHYHIVKEHSYYVSELEADRTYWKQVLIGDWECDGIPGLLNMGPKTAEKLLQDCISNEEMETVVKTTYLDAAVLNKKTGKYCTKLKGKIKAETDKQDDVYNEIRTLIWILRCPNDNKETTKSKEESSEDKTSRLI